MISEQGTRHHISIGSDLPGHAWEVFLQKWFELMDRFINVEQDNQRDVDLPYWHNEYSNAGNLAAVAWALGGVALQECSVNKGQEENATTKGRCDLWIRIPALGFEYVLETKFAWVPTLSAAHNAFKRLSEFGSNQIRNYSTGMKKCPRMTACFLSVYSQSEADAREILRDLRRDYDQRQQPTSLLAIYEPPLGTRIDYEENGRKDFYPGVALLAQMAQ